MSSATFPLLKLPWLCIKCLIKNLDLFDIIFFACISKRSRRLVKYSRLHLNGLKVYMISSVRIKLVRDKMNWFFELDLRTMERMDETPIVLLKDPFPLYTRIWGRYSLDSTLSTGDNKLALKIAMELLNDLFTCSVDNVYISGDNLCENIGVNSTVNLQITGDEPLDSEQLKLFLKSLEVTGECEIIAPIQDDFSSLELFTCQDLVLVNGSASWVTKEILSQFTAPQLTFVHPQFNLDDLFDFITQWFNSGNTTLEYLYVRFKDLIKPEELRKKIDHLDPMPFCEERRSERPVAENSPKMNLSEGLDILRDDGLLATIDLWTSDTIIFYVWHQRFQDPSEIEEERVNLYPWRMSIVHNM